jgi:DNA-binding PadR family transcriptional regulator
VASSNLLEKLRERVLKNFMDILVLREIEEHPLSGYDVIGLAHRRFGVLISSGTVYSLLYSLEREGLIQGVSNGRRRAYVLTEKGEQNIEAITKTDKEIQNFIKNISSINTTNSTPTRMHEHWVN